MIDLFVVKGAGDKVGEEINDPLITNDYIAVKRGTAYIYENWYERKIRKINVPLREGLYIGCIANVTEGNLGISGNHLLTAYKIDISEAGITCNIDIEQQVEGS